MFSARVPKAFAYERAVCRRCPILRGGAGMEYKAYIVQAFEREPGQWRASIWRSDAKPLEESKRIKLDEFITAFDTATRSAAPQMALAAIDAASFSRRGVRDEDASLPRQEVFLEKF
jgi:hypothetical protein